MAHRNDGPAEAGQRQREKDADAWLSEGTSLARRLAGKALPRSCRTPRWLLKQHYGMVMHEAEVLTISTLFQVLALLLMPWVRKVSAATGEAGGGH